MAGRDSDTGFQPSGLQGPQPEGLQGC
jgi:hypothetical protein